MHLIDTHSHLYAKEFDDDRPDVIRSAKAAGVQAILLANEDAGSIDAINRLCDMAQDFAFPMMGLHPTSVKEGYLNEMRLIETALTRRKYVAIGEIGIDLYWDKRYLKEQKAVFEEQLRWSIDLQLPVAIHSRDSLYEILDSIHKTGVDRLKGVFHCFGGSKEQWREIAGLSTFMIGIGGIVTYKNCRLCETLKHVPVEKIVLETDAPYLTPVPYRGKRNEPAYLVETAKKVAEIYQKTTETIANLTFDNAVQLFRIPSQNADNEPVCQFV